MYSSVVGDPEDNEGPTQSIRSGTSRKEEAMTFLGPAMAMGRRCVLPSLALPCLAVDCLAVDCLALPPNRRVAPLCTQQCILVHCTCGMSWSGGANCCISIVRLTGTTEKHGLVGGVSVLCLCM